VNVSLDYFLPYQQAWINGEEPFGLGEKSRRIGWTYASSYRAVERRVKRLGNLYFSSADLTASQEFVEYCSTWCRVFNEVAEYGTEEEVIDDEKITSQVIRFNNGLKIVAGSSNPKFFRSKGGDADADEFAFHRQPRELLKAAQATAIFWGYKLRAWSTHNGEGSYFNFLVKQGRAFADWEHRHAADPSIGPFTGVKVRVQRVTVLDAVEQGIVEVIRQAKGKLKSRPAPDAKARQEWLDELRATCVDEDTWNEEFLCQPSSDQSSLLTYDLIQSCEAANLVLQSIDQLDPSKRYYAGFDVGRKRDLSVLWVLERVGDVFWTRCLYRLAKMNFTAQEELLASLMANRAVKRLCIDSTGIGMMLAERLGQRFGTYRAEGVNFTAPVKSELAMPLLRVFQDKRVRIPADADVRESLHKVRKIVTAANNVRLDADRDEAGHADEFWALALAVHAADDLKVPLPPGRVMKPVGW
jgi:phage FluMu gp28-like protein